MKKQKFKINKYGVTVPTDIMKMNFSEKTCNDVLEIYYKNENIKLIVDKICDKAKSPEQLISMFTIFLKIATLHKNISEVTKND